MKYTKGPWRIASPKKLFDVNSQHDRLIYAEGGRHVAEVFQFQGYEHNLSREEVEANALIIAAAPDLVAALEKINRIAKDPNVRTKQTMLQMCGFLDEVILSIIEPVLTQAEGKE